MKKQLLYIFLICTLLFSCTKQKEFAASQENLKKISSKINSDLTKLRQNIETLTHDLDYKIAYYKAFEIDFFANYTFDDQKNLAASEGNQESAIYLSNKVALSDSLKKFIINSEAFNDLFQKVIEQNVLLSQIYFQKHNSFLRIYPYIEVSKHISNNFNVLNTLTYKQTQEKPHFEDHAYWIDKPFTDPYGRGWIIACAEPVFYRNKFIGVLSGDISISELKVDYLSSNNDILLLVNSNFDLIAATKNGEKFLSIPAYREYQYYKPITENVFLYNHSFVKEHNSDGFKESIKEIRSGKKKSSFYYNTKKHTIISEKIEETGWYLLQIIN